MVVNLDYLIKKIRLNGGKTAPLVAEAIELLSKDIKIATAQIEASKDHKIFWEAVANCHLAAQELEEARTATGFVTQKEMEEALEWSNWTMVAVSIASAILGGCIVALAV